MRPWGSRAHQIGLEASLEDPGTYRMEPPGDVPVGVARVRAPLCSEETSNINHVFGHGYGFLSCLLFEKGPVVGYVSKKHGRSHQYQKQSSRVLLSCSRSASVLLPFGFRSASVLRLQSGMGKIRTLGSVCSASTADRRRKKWYSSDFDKE